MCICINCFFLKNCETYQFIEQKHGLKFKEEQLKPFKPKQTILKNEAQLDTNSKTLVDWDIRECTNFLEKHGNWFDFNELL